MQVRPISPYLSIYRPQIGSISSILGRITGLILIISFIFFFLLEDLRGIFLVTSYDFYCILFFFYKSKCVTSLGFVTFLLYSLLFHIFFGLRYIVWSVTGGIFQPYNSLDSFGVAFWTYSTIIMIVYYFWPIIIFIN